MARRKARKAPTIKKTDSIKATNSPSQYSLRRRIVDPSDSIEVIPVTRKSAKKVSLKRVDKKSKGSSIEAKVVVRSKSSEISNADASKNLRLRTSTLRSKGSMLNKMTKILPAKSTKMIDKCMKVEIQSSVTEHENCNTSTEIQMSKNLPTDKTGEVSKCAEVEIGSLDSEQNNCNTGDDCEMSEALLTDVISKVDSCVVVGIKSSTSDKENCNAGTECIVSESLLEKENVDNCVKVEIVSPISVRKTSNDDTKCKVSEILPVDKIEKVKILPFILEEENCNTDSKCKVSEILPMDKNDKDDSCVKVEIVSSNSEQENCNAGTECKVSEILSVVKKEIVDNCVKVVSSSSEPQSCNKCVEYNAEIYSNKQSGLEDKNEEIISNSKNSCILNTDKIESDAQNEDCENVSNDLEDFSIEFLQNELLDAFDDEMLDITDKPLESKECNEDLINDVASGDTPSKIEFKKGISETNTRENLIVKCANAKNDNNTKSVIISNLQKEDERSSSVSKSANAVCESNSGVASNIIDEKNVEIEEKDFDLILDEILCYDEDIDEIESNIKDEHDDTQTHINEKVKGIVEDHSDVKVDRTVKSVKELVNIDINTDRISQRMIKTVNGEKIKDGEYEVVVIICDTFFSNFEIFWNFRIKPYLIFVKDFAFNDIRDILKELALLDKKMLLLCFLMSTTLLKYSKSSSCHDHTPVKLFSSDAVDKNVDNEVTSFITALFKERSRIANLLPSGSILNILPFLSMDVLKVQKQIISEHLNATGHDVSELLLPKKSYIDLHHYLCNLILKVNYELERISLLNLKPYYKWFNKFYSSFIMKKQFFLHSSKIGLSNSCLRSIAGHLFLSIFYCFGYKEKSLPLIAQPDGAQNFVVHSNIDLKRYTVDSLLPPLEFYVDKFSDKNLVKIQESKFGIINVYPVIVCVSLLEIMKLPTKEDIKQVAKLRYYQKDLLESSVLDAAAVSSRELVKTLRKVKVNLNAHVPVFVLCSLFPFDVALYQNIAKKSKITDKGKASEFDTEYLKTLQKVIMHIFKAVNDWMLSEAKHKRLLFCDLFDMFYTVNNGTIAIKDGILVDGYNLTAETKVAVFQKLNDFLQVHIFKSNSVSTESQVDKSTDIYSDNCGQVNQFTIVPTKDKDLTQMESNHFEGSDEINFIRRSPGQEKYSRKSPRLDDKISVEKKTSSRQSKSPSSDTKGRIHRCSKSRSRDRRISRSRSSYRERRLSRSRSRSGYRDRRRLSRSRSRASYRDERRLSKSGSRSGYRGGQRLSRSRSRSGYRDRQQLSRSRSRDRRVHRSHSKLSLRGRRYSRSCSRSRKSRGSCDRDVRYNRSHSRELNPMDISASEEKDLRDTLSEMRVRNQPLQVSPSQDNDLRDTLSGRNKGYRSRSPSQDSDLRNHLSGVKKKEYISSDNSVNKLDQVVSQPQNVSGERKEKSLSPNDAFDKYKQLNRHCHLSAEKTVKSLSPHDTFDKFRQLSRHRNLSGERKKRSLSPNDAFDNYKKLISHRHLSDERKKRSLSPDDVVNIHRQPLSRALSSSHTNEDIKEVNYPAAFNAAPKKEVNYPDAFKEPSKREVNYPQAFKEATVYHQCDKAQKSNLNRGHTDALRNDNINSIAIDNLWKAHSRECGMYRNKPDAHPSYNKEWTSFVDTWCSEYGVDPTSNLASTTWKNYWPSRMEQLFNFTWEQKKAECLKTLNEKKAKCMEESKPQKPKVMDDKRVAAKLLPPYTEVVEMLDELCQYAVYIGDTRDSYHLIKTKIIKALGCKKNVWESFENADLELLRKAAKKFDSVLKSNVLFSKQGIVQRVFNRLKIILMHLDGLYGPNREQNFSQRGNLFEVNIAPKDQNLNLSGILNSYRSDNQVKHFPEIKQVVGSSFKSMSSASCSGQALSINKSNACMSQGGPTSSGNATSLSNMHDAFHNLSNADLEIIAKATLGKDNAYIFTSILRHLNSKGIMNSNINMDHVKEIIMSVKTIQQNRPNATYSPTKPLLTPPHVKNQYNDLFESGNSFPNLSQGRSNARLQFDTNDLLEDLHINKGENTRENENDFAHSLMDYGEDLDEDSFSIHKAGNSNRTMLGKPFTSSSATMGVSLASMPFEKQLEMLTNFKFLSCQMQKEALEIIRITKQNNPLLAVALEKALEG